MGASDWTRRLIDELEVKCLEEKRDDDLHLLVGEVDPGAAVRPTAKANEGIGGRLGARRVMTPWEVVRGVRVDLLQTVREPGREQEHSAGRDGKIIDHQLLLHQ